jgi:hypothetical protein
VSDDSQRTLAGSLLLERLELRRDIAAIKADLGKRADILVKFGNMLRSNPQVIEIDEQSLPAEYAQRAQKFNSEDLDSKRIAALVDELRKKTDRLGVAEQEIRGMGYLLD